jgi:hypothetical protein
VKSGFERCERANDFITQLLHALQRPPFGQPPEIKLFRNVTVVIKPGQAFHRTVQSSRAPAAWRFQFVISFLPKMSPRSSFPMHGAIILQTMHESAQKSSIGSARGWTKRAGISSAIGPTCAPAI